MIIQQFWSSASLCYQTHGVRAQQRMILFLWLLQRSSTAVAIIIDAPSGMGIIMLLVNGTYTFSDMLLALCM